MVRKHCIVGAESLFAQQSQHANSAVPGESAVAAPTAMLLP
jgi:hypothetical protein